MLTFSIEYFTWVPVQSVVGIPSIVLPLFGVCLLSGSRSIKYGDVHWVTKWSIQEAVPVKRWSMRKGDSPGSILSSEYV